MNLYVLRHGESDYNLQGKFQGQVNTLLNQTGINQANKTKKELKHIKFDIVISSPLSRAVETTKIVTNINPIIDKRIIERSFGKLEGKSSICDFEEKIEEYNIETYEQLCERIYSFLDDLIEQCSDKKNVLVGTHACVAQIIETYFNKNKNKSNWKDCYLKNAEYKVYKI